MNETPQIKTQTYGSSTYTAGSLHAPEHVVDSTALSGWRMPPDGPRNFINAGRPHLDWADIERRIQQEALAKPLQPPLQKKVEPMARIVKVYIADPDAALDLQKRVLHSGEEQLTDLTDQELYYDIAVGDLLKAHNGLRIVTLDKKATAKAGKDIFLEPIRIRDLKMIVVTIAEF
jgi:hypothetical protein